MIKGNPAGAVEYLKNGKIIAYPTETVFGIGCDPYQEHVVERIFHLKNRPPTKKFILISSSYDQLEEVIDTKKITDEVLNSWPGPNTWLVPPNTKLPKWLISEENGLIAVRVSEHNAVKEICEKFGKPIISTSANLYKSENLKNYKDVENIFSEKIDYLVIGDTGKYKNPSIIRNMLTGEIVRK
tara:strand:+ start:864 stop:1415 length:552 start_codon:yes stop_codon:yes gene_type:complete